jgi:hypothetical protein
MAQPASARAVAGQPSAGRAAVAAPAAGYGPAVNKAAEPDIGKRKGRSKKGGEPDPNRDGRERADYIGRDLHDDELAETDALHGRGPRQCRQGQERRKCYAERGSREGPAHPVQPGRADPDDSDRPYLAESHAAPSPGYEAPRTNPVPQPYGRGVPTPIAMPSPPVVAGNPGPLAAAAAAHEARVTMRPHIPGGTSR